VPFLFSYVLVRALSAILNYYLTIAL